MNSDKHTLIDLFAGCGGAGLGFHMAGFETIIANEIHPDPALTYQKNLLIGKENRMIVGDIKKVFSNRAIDEIGIKPFEIDCISGGPPCQGFSNAGPKIADDPRNKLYREYLRVIRKVKPKALFFENVPGFCNRYGLNLQSHLINSLEKIGYLIDAKKIYSCFYGVPQLRARFILIGIHKKYSNSDNITLPEYDWDIEMLNSQMTAEKVIGDLNSYHIKGGYGTGTNLESDFYMIEAFSEFQKEMRKNTSINLNGYTWNTKIPMHGNIVQKRFKMLLEGNSLQSLRNSDLETKKLSQRPLKADKFPRITIVSLPDDYVHYDISMPRTFSVRECARFQTFPDDFKFYGKRTSGGKRRRFDCPQYTQVGNAIPPRLAKKIAEKIKTYLQ
jgi:DNA (cytosine-5)-methyltransferase 1